MTKISEISKMSKNYKKLQKNIARGTTDPGIASITWIIFQASYKAGKFASNATNSGATEINNQLF